MGSRNLKHSNDLIMLNLIHVSKLGPTTFTLQGIHFSLKLDRIIDLKYSIQLPKITAMIQQWKRRILTPIGRVTVAKT